MPEPQTVPADLLRAAAARRGWIALVLGAGCSLEAPTNLKLSSVYAEDIHRQLIAEGVLAERDCGDPASLAAVATAVWEKHGSQRAVVERLPRVAFRFAQPNAGHLIAAALMREGAISAVLTLNYDLAMTTALQHLSATEVDVIPGPTAISELGHASLIYLHRSVEEQDFELWILRAAALDEEWENHWEEVIAQRVVTTPQTVFAGLGSPADVLNHTLDKVRGSLEVGQHQTYIVDPARETPFAESLGVPDGNHIQLGWCDFMEHVAQRVLLEVEHELSAACRQLIEENGWGREADDVPNLCERLFRIGLVDAGKLRAQWLLSDESYCRQTNNTLLIADLVLGVGIIERHLGGESFFAQDGRITCVLPTGNRLEMVAVSGEGTRRWPVLESRARERIRAFNEGPSRPRYVLLGGFTGPAGDDSFAPPPDLIEEFDADDITQGPPPLTFLSVDEVRSHPEMLDGAF